MSERAREAEREIERQRERERDEREGEREREREREREGGREREGCSISGCGPASSEERCITELVAGKLGIPMRCCFGFLQTKVMT